MRLEEEKKLQAAREERERLRDEEKVRFQQVMEVLNQEMQLRTETLASWKTENLKQKQVGDIECSDLCVCVCTHFTPYMYVANIMHSNLLNAWQEEEHLTPILRLAVLWINCTLSS